MKKETLEEAAKEYAEKVGNVTGKGWLYDAVKFGANWQAERMYDEEEVLELLWKREWSYEHSMPFITVDDWFKQNKKK
jgi:hypothetical protein